MPNKQIETLIKPIIENAINPDQKTLQYHPNISDQMELFARLLLRWNKNIRLTGANDVKEITERHIVDSLLGLHALSLLPPESVVMDVGSGGGFPAIPLAILRPDLQWILVESHHKRAAFLQQAKRDLKIPHMNIRPTRFSGSPETEKLPTNCSCITFRAVAPEQIYSFLPKYLLDDGTILYWGTQQPPAPHPPELTLIRSHPYTLPQGESFCLYTFSKTQTPTNRPSL